MKKKILLVASLLGTSLALASCKGQEVKVKEYGEDPKVEESSLTKLSNQEDINNQLDQMVFQDVSSLIDWDDPNSMPYYKQYKKASDSVLDNYEAIVIKEYTKNDTLYSYSSVSIDIKNGNVYGYFKKYETKDDKEEVLATLESTVIQNDENESYTVYTSVALNNYQVVTGIHDEYVENLGSIKVKDYGYASGQVNMKATFESSSTSSHLFSLTNQGENYDLSISNLVKQYSFPYYLPSSRPDQVYVNDDRSTVLLKRETQFVTYTSLVQNNLFSSFTEESVTGSHFTKKKVEYVKKTLVDLNIDKDSFKEDGFLSTNIEHLFFDLGIYGSNFLYYLSESDYLKDNFEISEGK